MQARLMMMGVLLLLMMDPVQGQFEYSAACIPDYSEGSNTYYRCRLIITGKTPSSIEIHTVNESINFTLPAGDVYEKEFGTEVIPILGTDSKAIRVVSSEEIQVLVYKYPETTNTAYQDVYMVPNQMRRSNEYYTSAFYNEDMQVCSAGYYHQFYLVASYYDDTEILVEQQDGMTYEETLPAFGTFLQTTKYWDNHLGMGTRIASSKPITVIAGNLCVNNEVSQRDTYASVIPDTASLGEEYIVPHITSDTTATPAGYSFTVVATEDDTAVYANEEMSLLTRGETTLFECPSKGESSLVVCTKPCLVVQYTKAKSSDYGLFMQNILSVEQFSTSASFTTLETYVTKQTSYLSLVLQGEAPGDDIFLNNITLGYLNWKASHGYASAYIKISQGVHRIESVNNRPFAAYVYVQTRQLASASGYSFLPSASSAMPPTKISTSKTNEPTDSTGPVTTPLSAVIGSLPQQVVRVNGTAHTEDGQTIAQACATAHLNSLNLKTTDMVVRVNEEIGKVLCMDADDIMVMPSSATLFFQQNKALLEIKHVLRVEGHHMVSEVESCALEVAEYLNDLANWQQPIFPPVSGCSRMELLPAYLNISETRWICGNQLDEELIEASSILSYESKVSEVLITADGSILDVDCTRSYSDEVDKKARFMMGEISRTLALNGCSDIVTAATHAQSVFAMGDQAYFQAVFFYVPSPGASFAQFVGCMQLIHDVSLQHENWNTGSQPGDPFLPVPPGCPALECDADTLDDEGHRWACV